MIDRTDRFVCLCPNFAGLVFPAVGVEGMEAPLGGATADQFIGGIVGQTLAVSPGDSTSSFRIRRA